MLLPILAAGLMLAAEDDSSLDPSTPRDVASAVGDCWNAVSAAGVDKSRLGETGWSLVAATADLANSPLQVWIKKGANHRIMLTDDVRAADYCTVITRLSSKADAEKTLTAMHSTLKSYDAKVTPERTEGGVAFVSLPRFAQVDTFHGAGATEDQPSLRIIVGYQIPEQS